MSALIALHRQSLLWKNQKTLNPMHPILPKMMNLKWLIALQPVLAHYEKALRRDGWETFESLKLIRPEDMQQ